MTDREAASGLEVLNGPVAVSKSPYPSDPVFVHSHSPHSAQISPSQAPELSYRAINGPQAPASQGPDSSYRDSDGQQLEQHPIPYREENERSSSRNICGLRPPTFWILVALVFIICAGAIGGGVGGSIAVDSNNDKAANSPSPTAQGAAAPSSSSIAASNPSGRFTTTSTITQEGSTRTSTVTETPTTTSWVTAPLPVPSANSQDHDSRFWLSVKNTDADRTTFGYLACTPVCWMYLSNSRLYGWYTHKTQYVDCNYKLVINNEGVDEDCLLYDAGFSIGTNNSLYHGDNARWFYCADKDSYFTVNPGGCDLKTMQVENSSGPNS